MSEFKVVYFYISDNFKYRDTLSLRLPNNMQRILFIRNFAIATTEEIKAGRRL